MTIKIKNNSHQYYFDGVSVLIKDDRLKFINDVVVYNTQNNQQLKCGEYSLDVLSGRLTIPGTQLIDGEHITITTI